MTKFDSTFKIVLEHYRKILEFSVNDLNTQIKKSILKGHPSACLKYYNELLAGTNFALQSRSRL